jgi:hypothetical protein
VVKYDGQAVFQLVGLEWYQIGGSILRWWQP